MQQFCKGYSIKSPHKGGDDCILLIDIQAERQLRTAKHLLLQRQTVKDSVNLPLGYGMGNCCTTPREIIYGSKQFGGAGLFHFYNDQGYGQLKTFLKFWHSVLLKIPVHLRQQVPLQI